MSSHTVDHCMLQMDFQWSTAEGVMTLGTTLTSVTMYSKPLGMQNGSSVVYFVKRAMPNVTTVACVRPHS